MPQDDTDMDTDSASVSRQMQEIQLPPVFEHFLKELGKDRKKLLREKAFAQADQLRTYIGQYMFPRLEEMVRLMAAMVIEAYSLAASNTNEVRRLHAFTVDELNRMGADLRDDDVNLPGVGPEVLDEFQQAFYALGTLLQKKYPEDTETQEAYNKVAATVGEMVEDLMSGYDDDDDDRDDDDYDDDRDDDGDNDGDDDGDDDGASDVDEEELISESKKARAEAAQKKKTEDEGAKESEEAKEPEGDRDA